jgi:hypothetical protein
MKNFKIGLRIWILITSVMSFLTGWAMLAHAGKPASLFQQAQTQATQDPSSNQTANLPTPLAMPTLIAPIPLDSASSSSAASNVNLQSLPALPVIQQQQNFMPSFRTRGS